MIVSDSLQYFAIGTVLHNEIHDTIVHLKASVSAFHNDSIYTLYSY
jgi:hypothetical protein